jgi:hypothetical protein
MIPVNNSVQSRDFKHPGKVNLILNSNLYCFFYENIVFPCLANNYESELAKRASRFLQCNEVLYSLGYNKVARINLSVDDQASIDAKVLGHVCNVGDEVRTDRILLSMHGGYSPLMFTVFSNSCEKFFNRGYSAFNPEEQQQIITALRAAADPILSPSALVPSIKSGELTFIPTGWDKHAICIGFCNRQMMIGNPGGEGSENCASPLMIFDIDPDRVTEELITYVLEIRNSDYEYGHSFIYHELPKILSPKSSENGEPGDPIDAESLHGCILQSRDDIIQHMLPFTKMGNCSFETAKSALVFAAISFKWPSIDDEVLKGRMGDVDTVTVYNEVEKTFKQIGDEMYIIFKLTALDHLADYCDRYYSKETGFPKEEMVHLALPREVIKKCWKRSKIVHNKIMDKAHIFYNLARWSAQADKFLKSHPHLAEFLTA